MRCSYCGGKTTEPLCVCCGKPVQSEEPLSSVLPTGPVPPVKQVAPAGAANKKSPAKPGGKTAAERKKATPLVTTSQKSAPAKTAQPQNAKAVAAQKPTQAYNTAGTAFKNPEPANTAQTNNKPAGGAPPLPGADSAPVGAAHAKIAKGWRTDAAEQVEISKLHGALRVFFIWECIQMIIGGVVMLLSGVVLVYSFVNVVWDIIAGGGEYDLTLREGVFTNLLVLVLVMMLSLYVFKINQAVVNRMRNRQITFLVPYYFYNLSNMLLAFMCYYIFYTSAGYIYFTASPEAIIYPTLFFAINAAISVAWVLYLFISPQVTRVYAKAGKKE